MKRTAMGGAITVFALEGLPEVRSGDDVAGLILEYAGTNDLAPGDVAVIAQKIVSKAEGAVVDLSEVTPSAFARSVAETTGKDARVVEVVLQQSRRIVRMSGGVLICETHHGFICANAGVDASNVPGDGIRAGYTGPSPAAQAGGGFTARGGGFVTVLPKDPDGSARALRKALEAKVGGPLGVIIADSFGRPWREGSLNVAIGAAGIRPLLDLRGQLDDHGRDLRTTQVAVADEIAAAAQLAGGELGRTPVVVIRGLPRDWLLPSEEDSAQMDPSKGDSATRPAESRNEGSMSSEPPSKGGASEGPGVPDTGARSLLRDSSRDLFR